MGRTSDARERLIQSGMELIHTGGYARAGVQEICNHAGVRKGSFYHFFPSKSDLAVAVVERFATLSAPLTAQALAPDLPPAERIERFFLLAAEIQQGFKTTDGWLKGCPFGNLALEMGGRDERLQRILETSLEGIIDRIERAIREDETDETARIRAEAIFNLLEGAILMAKTHNDPACIRRMAGVARDLATGSHAGTTREENRQ